MVTDRGLMIFRYSCKDLSYEGEAQLTTLVTSGNEGDREIGWCRNEPLGMYWSAVTPADWTNPSGRTRLIQKLGFDHWTIRQDASDQPRRLGFAVPNEGNATHRGFSIPDWAILIISLILPGVRALRCVSHLMNRTARIHVAHKRSSFSVARDILARLCVASTLIATVVLAWVWTKSYRADLAVEHSFNQTTLQLGTSPGRLSFFHGILFHPNTPMYNSRIYFFPRTQMNDDMDKGEWSSPSGQFAGIRWNHSENDIGKNWTFQIPIWMIILPLFALPLLSTKRFLVRHYRAVHGQCITCGYDLRATPGRCPECGAIPDSLTLHRRA
jgi:hypothetical protein